MLSNNTIEKIKEIANNLIKRQDMQKREINIKDIYIPKGNKLIRIYLTKQDGVTIDDCAYFHKEFIVLLNVEGIENNDFTLEVSSPGTENQN